VGAVGLLGPLAPNCFCQVSYICQHKGLRAAQEQQQQVHRAVRSLARVMSPTLLSRAASSSGPVVTMAAPPLRGSHWTAGCPAARAAEASNKRTVFSCMAAA
jgi:hypothetical protein